MGKSQYSKYHASNFQVIWGCSWFGALQSLFWCSSREWLGHIRISQCHEIPLIKTPRAESSVLWLSPNCALGFPSEPVEINVPWNEIPSFLTMWFPRSGGFMFPWQIRVVVSVLMLSLLFLQHFHPLKNCFSLHSQQLFNEWASFYRAEF